MNKSAYLGAGLLAGFLLALPALGLAAPAFGIERFFTRTADGSLPADPFLANGVATGAGTELYTASGTGPAAKNALATSGTPAAYIDYELLSLVYPDFAPSDAAKAAGELPTGVTITQAQGLNCMARVQENLEAADLTLADIAFMRIFLDNPAEAPRADYAGWNSAYRKFMANLDLKTGAPIPAYEPLIYPNETRPARSNVEVATLPVAGWLIEIEAVAVYPKHKPSWWW